VSVDNMSSQEPIEPMLYGTAEISHLCTDYDFGEVLYSRCRVNGTYDDGSWMHQFQNAPDGTGGTENTATIKLSNLDALVKLGAVYAGNGSDPADYTQRPEIACFSVCRQQFKDRCTMFTYDGITEDRYCQLLFPLSPLRFMQTACLDEACCGLSSERPQHVALCTDCKQCHATDCDSSKCSKPLFNAVLIT
jgi:hypothetical protein